MIVLNLLWSCSSGLLSRSVTLTLAVVPTWTLQDIPFSEKGEYQTNSPTLYVTCIDPLPVHTPLHIAILVYLVLVQPSMNTIELTS